MIVIVLVAICTWLLPAGQYNKLSVSDKAFSITTNSSEIKLPLTQHTPDSLRNLLTGRYANPFPYPAVLPNKKEPARLDGAVKHIYTLQEGVIGADGY